MSGWAASAVPYLKAFHICMIAVWSAGLLALPMMLARHDPAIGQSDYSRIREASHYAFTLVVTPAAVLAIASGTVLIFLREVFDLWMFAKLAFVGLMVAFHAWVGHILISVAETRGEHDPPDPWVPLALCILPILAVLTMVLAKPDLGVLPVPGWLTQPLGVQLPLDVPRR